MIFPTEYWLQRELVKSYCMCETAVNFASAESVLGRSFWYTVLTFPKNKWPEIQTSKLTKMNHATSLIKLAFKKTFESVRINGLVYESMDCLCSRVSLQPRYNKHTNTFNRSRLIKAVVSLDLSSLCYSFWVSILTEEYSNLQGSLPARCQLYC